MLKQKRVVRFTAILSCLVLLVGMMFYRTFPAATVSASSTAVTKIMPLGDSITDGDFWRSTLYSKLTDTGYNVQFVGSKGDNEGYWGMRVCDLAASGDLAGWLSSSNPDIVLMHFGTNDCFDDEKDTAQILNAYNTLLEEMRANNPNMILFIAKIIPLASYHTVYNERVNALNASIDGWAEEHATSQSPIYVVDQHTGFTDFDIGDGVHPSTSGGQKMAEKWYEALCPVLSEIQDVETPVTSEVPVATTETPVSSEAPVTSEAPVVTTETPVTSEAPVITTETPVTSNGLQLSTETNAWSGGYTMSVTISNPSASDVNGWKLILSKSDFTISSIWCADMTETEDSYIITPLSWNQTVSAGGSVNFGLQATGTVDTAFTYTLE